MLTAADYTCRNCGIDLEAKLAFEDCTGAEHECPHGTTHWFDWKPDLHRENVPIDRQLLDLAVRLSAGMAIVASTL